jgi:hypothetical protein
MGNQWSKWFVRRATLLSRQNHLSLQAKTAFPLPLTPHLHGLVQWNMWQVFAAISEHRRELSAKDISLASEQRSHRRLCSSSVGGWRAPTAASFHLYFTVATFICSSLFLSIFLHKQDKVDKRSDKYVSLEWVTARRIIGRAWFLRIKRTGNQYEANIYLIKISGFSHWTKRNVVQGSTQVKFGAGNVTRSLPCFAQRVLAFLSYRFWVPVNTYCATITENHSWIAQTAFQSGCRPLSNFRFTD